MYELKCYDPMPFSSVDLVFVTGLRYFA